MVWEAKREGFIYVKYLLYDIHHSKHLACIISFNDHNKFPRQLLHFYLEKQLTNQPWEQWQRMAKELIGETSNLRE